MSSTMILAMNLAIECNNVGVALLERGYGDEALEAFRVSAQLMYPVSRNINKHPCVPEPPAELYVEQNSLELEDRISFLLHPQAAITGAIKQVEADLQRIKDNFLGFNFYENRCIGQDDSFVYATPFTITHRSADLTNCTIDSAIIVYNMGLAYHLNGGGSQAVLSHALCLFNAAFCLAYPATHDKRAVKVVMASLNNAGLINHRQGEYDLARQYLDSLSSFVSALPSAENVDEKEERNRFLLNAMLLQKPGIAPAA